ncbi:hypothetical protein KAR91_55820 [Candidatus Pacearchaeota archaeon]|nr:hypothetical protein [Candidatus Pacearchaeota archaeon]
MDKNPLPTNTAILENIWIQYGALGLLFIFLIIAVVVLYRINRAKDKIHKEEWEMLRVEQRKDREISDKRHDERAAFFIDTMNKSSAKFAVVVEGVLKDNNQFLVENKVVLANCKR